MDKRWKRRLAEIETLKLKFKGKPWRPPMPDYHVEQRVAPLSNTIPKGSLTPAKRQPAGARQFATGTTHKQGPQLLTPGMIANEMQYIGGKKV